MDKNTSEERKPYFYWPYNPEKQGILYEMLLEKKMILPNVNFLNSFLDEIVPPKYSTSWEIKTTSLFALLFLLYKKNKYSGSESLGIIAYKLFRIQKSSLNSIKNNFQEFYIRSKSDDYFSKKHGEILLLVEKLKL